MTVKTHTGGVSNTVEQIVEKFALQATMRSGEGQNSNSITPRIHSLHNGVRHRFPDTVFLGAYLAPLSLRNRFPLTYCISNIRQQLMHSSPGEKGVVLVLQRQYTSLRQSNLLKAEQKLAPNSLQKSFRVRALYW